MSLEQRARTTLATHSPRIVGGFAMSGGAVDDELHAIDEALTWATKDGIRYWPWLDKLLDERNTVALLAPLDYDAADV